MTASNQELPSAMDAAIAREALCRMTGTAAVRVEPVPHQGAVNWVFKGEAGGSCFAIRVNRQRAAAQAHQEYARERWCTVHAGSVGVRAPAVMAIDTSRERTWMIEEWIDGQHPAVSPETYWRLGDCSRKLSGVLLAPTGALFAGLSGDWAAQVDYNLSQLTLDDALLRLGVYPAERQKAHRAAFMRLRNARFAVGLQHGDLAPGNVIVRANGEWVLIDWGCARFDVAPIVPINELRLQRLESHQPPLACLRAFVEGAGITWDQCTAIEPNLNAWLALKAIDLVRWAIDRYPSRVTELSNRAQDVVTKYLLDQLPLGGS